MAIASGQSCACMARAGDQDQAGHAARILLDEQAEHIVRLVPLPGALAAPRSGAAPPLSVKARLAARRYWPAAPAKSPPTPSASPTRIWTSGAPGIGGLEPARAGQRLVGLAAAEQGARSAGPGRGRRPDSRSAARRTPANSPSPSGSSAAQRAGLRLGGAGEIERGRRRLAGPRQRPADQRQRIGVGVGPVGDRPQRRDRRRRDRSSATGRRRAAGGRGDCPAARGPAARGGAPPAPHCRSRNRSR